MTFEALRNSQRRPLRVKFNSRHLFDVRDSRFALQVTVATHPPDSRSAEPDVDNTESPFPRLARTSSTERTCTHKFLISATNTSGHRSVIGTVETLAEGRKLTRTAERADERTRWRLAIRHHRSFCNEICSLSASVFVRERLDVINTTAPAKPASCLLGGHQQPSRLDSTIHFDRHQARQCKLDNDKSASLRRRPTLLKPPQGKQQIKSSSVFGPGRSHSQPDELGHHEAPETCGDLKF